MKLLFDLLTNYETFIYVLPVYKYKLNIAKILQSKMEVVKIKNLNKSHMNKAFIVKGRVKYTKLENNKNWNIKHLNSIIFDDSSEIQVMAYEHCDMVSRQLKNGNVVEIKNGKLIDNKNNKKTKHKYMIMLDSHSIITTINKDEVNNDDFPVHKYTSGAVLKTILPGMIIDVNGVLVQLNRDTSINSESKIFRKGIIKVDSTEIEVRFFGKKAEKLYNVGDKLFLCRVKYIAFQGCEYLSVESSSNVRCRQNQQSRHVPADLKDFTTGLSDQKQSTSGSTPCNKNSERSHECIDFTMLCFLFIYYFFVSVYTRTCQNNASIFNFSNFSDFTIRSPDQKQSTSGSTSSIKRRIQDFYVEEVTSKIIKIDEPKESFSDEKFTKVVLNLLKNIKNNKEVVKLLNYGNQIKD
ncbi:Uncharacterized protein FWK35_00012493 [Aphis craccivora]|uniref:OB domain-containing protein n=1 Tax=Aphis craccivora TaxID=307492 RepID=A0A6G0YM61_APHCR|nr:Uncharacterized protein FWK35_00012493 [Aphis craccivora]